MSSFSSRRALAALRRALGRVLGRGRAPRPREQEWLRLILLVRRLQSGQLAIAKRFDEVRALTGALGSVRPELGALREQLAAHGEGERPAGAAGAAHPLEPGLARLGEVTARLETIAAQAPTELPFKNELDAVLGRLGETTARLEGAEEAVRVIGGQEELARLYERVQELAERAARAPEPSVPGEPALDPRLSELLERVEKALQEPPAAESSEVLARLEALLEQLGAQPQPRAETGMSEALLARYEALAERLEHAPAALPDLPADAVLASGEIVGLRAELDEQRARFQCELEARRRVEAELETLRTQIRASELARVELETRHSAELAQVADHARRKLLVLEDDLKKRKRGLAELTQQNIALQNALARHTSGEAPHPIEPPAPLPRGGSAPLARLMKPDGAGEGSSTP